MADLLTMEEIEAAYDGEWVVLTDVESKPDSVIRRARVYWHGSNHDEAWEKAEEIPPPRDIGVLYLGDPWAKDAPVPVL